MTFVCNIAICTIFSHTLSCSRVVTDAYVLLLPYLSLQVRPFNPRHSLIHAICHSLRVKLQQKHRRFQSNLDNNLIIDPHKRTV
jgi:hypothetical protein